MYNSMHPPHYQNGYWNQNQPPYSPYIYPPVMQIATVSAVPWSTGLCDCYEDYSSCCLTFWCPCIAFGRIAEALDEGTVPCWVSSLLYALLLGVINCACCFSCFYRTKLRQQHSLEEEPCNDMFVHLFLEECALCQEYRELQNRGYVMYLGWEGNVERQRRMAMNAMQPPPGLEVGMMPPPGLEVGMMR